MQHSGQLVKQWMSSNDLQCAMVMKMSSITAPTCSVMRMVQRHIMVQSSVRRRSWITSSGPKAARRSFSADKKPVFAMHQSFIRHIYIYTMLSAITESDVLW